LLIASGVINQLLAVMGQSPMCFFLLSWDGNCPNQTRCKGVSFIQSRWSVFAPEVLLFGTSLGAATTIRKSYVCRVRAKLKTVGPVS
jgi:hypothetical protein